MGWIRNKLAGYVRSSSVLKDLMNVPPEGFYNARRLHAPFAAGEEISHGGATGPGAAILRLVKRLPGHGVEHDLNLYMYHIIKEALPIAQNALENRRYLEGELILKSKDQGLLRDIQDFAANVPVGNYTREAQALRGLQTAINAMFDNSDTYGLSVIDPQLDEGGQDLRRLIIPNPRTFYYKLDKVTRDNRLYHKRSDGVEVEITDPNIIIFAFRYNTEGAWPIPLYWGLPFTTETMIRMIVSMNNLWWRAGDPSSLYALEYDKESNRKDAEIEADLDELQATIEAVVKNKRVGKVSDGFIGVKGGKVTSMTIGGNALSESLAAYFREHYTTIAGQIVARSATPVWMYPDLEIAGDGLGSTRADHQDAVSMAAAAKRNEPKINITKRIINLWLTLNKSVTAIGRYEADWQYANLTDEKRYEEIRGARHNADTSAVELVQRLVDLEVLPDTDRVAHLVRYGVLPDVDQ